MASVGHDGGEIITISDEERAASTPSSVSTRQILPQPASSSKRSAVWAYFSPNPNMTRKE